MTTLRLILGDQLNPLHSWFNQPRELAGADLVYVLMEVRQETDYVLHHAQKFLAIFAAMRDFARQLVDAGHRVHYLTIDDSANQASMTANLDALIGHYSATVFEYQDPDEWRLDGQLADYARGLKITCQKVSSEHFYTERHEAAALFAGRTKWLMDTFYRHMRVRHKVLVDDAKKPVGGRWNFDAENRKSWPGVPLEASDARTPHDHSAL